MTPAEVASLKDQLAELGFNLVFDVVDEQSVWLCHAVREFQIYAGMSRVAKVKAGSADLPRWLDRLEAIDNANRYTGPIDGVFDQATLQPILDFWREKSYRCPVVAEIYVNNGKPRWPELGADTPAVRGNYWRYDDPRIVAFVDDSKEKDPYGKLQVRVCDLTGMFEGPHAADRLVKTGRIRKHLVTSGSGKKKKTDVWIGGFVGDSRIVTQTAEVLPKTLTDKEWSALGDAAKRTFRVVRAVSEQECLGYLQSINGYDDAWMSLGPCHWTLALAVPGKSDPEDVAGAGELPAFLAYWAATEAQDAKAKLIDPFGVVPKPDWVNGKPPTAPGPLCSYTGRLNWRSGPVTGPAQNGPIDKVKNLDWLRTTHWFWRFLALARGVKSFRLRQWHMTRIRLRDILAFEVDPMDRPGKPPGPNKVAVSKLATSEAAVALVLRCHIRKSGFLTQARLAHPSLRLALAFANIAEADVSKWKDPEEAQLIAGLLASAAVAKLPPAVAAKLQKLPIERIHEMRDALAALQPAGELLDQCRQLLSWPQPSRFAWGRKGAAFKLEKDAATPGLRRERGSFLLDKDGLLT
ncbi:MAG: hypothetical protein ING77_09740 [Rhodocyclaceae bacterium]|nr:hypothetical protein [Rhodocyclaceae bacterium]